MKFTIVGSVNTDLVTTLTSVPRGGETVHATDFETHQGGKGANQAFALRRLTNSELSTVSMVGCVGDDTFGEAALKHLKNAGVDVSHVSVKGDARTGVATILVEGSGENRIMVYSGANGLVAPPDTYDADFVVLQNEIPLETTFEVMRQCRSRGIKSVFNPSPLPDRPVKEWPHVDILVVNEGEAAAIAQTEDGADAQSSFPRLLELADLVVVTLGAQGVLFQTADDAKPTFVPAHKVEHIVDTTGAGDTFLAAFLSQFEDAETSMEDRVKFAARAAALAVTRAGAASSVPTLNEVLSM